MKFNENLKYLRKKEGLTQEDLAEKLNVSRQSVTKWESGQSLPDIEKVKEIAYMFSVSVDTLIGDVESKTTNKIKKKIDDIGWFIFGFAVFLINIMSSIYYLFSQKIQDEDTMYVITGLIAIIAFLIFVAALKSYLKNNEDVILNMKDTKEGKKERTTHIVRKYLISLFYVCLFSPLLHIGRLSEGMNVFISETIIFAVIGLVLDLILAFNEYFKLERKVKELNKD